MPKGSFENVRPSRSNFVLDKVSDEETSKVTDPNLGPSPLEFGEYLTWACKRLQVDARVNPVKTRLNEYVSLSDESKSKKQKPTNYLSKKFQSTAQGVSYLKLNQSLHDSIFNVITIYTIYDHNENLVQLNIDNNRKVPRVLLKIVGLIIPFQTYLTNIIINRGIDNVSIHELNKFLAISNITDICLDNTVISNANYDMLLENESNLRQLSLARCRLDDEVVEKITSKLLYPLPASKTLVILNLASNKITDKGAKHVANALKSNRQLAYINLADNSIDDEGAMAILQVLIEFRLSMDEITLLRSRYVRFLKERQCFLTQTVMQSRVEDVDNKNHKKKPIKPARASSFSSPKKSIIVEEKNEFIDPFSAEQIYNKGGETYCFGNNQLAYLSLAYNNISYLTVKKLLTVLQTQKTLDRQPRGLINVSIEGNYIPENCRELIQIDEILNSYLTVYCSRRQSAGRKKAYTARSAKS